MSLAGTDWQHHRHFAQAAEAYRRLLVKTMNDELAYRSISRRYEADVRGRATWEAVPDFEYRPPSLGRVLVEQAAAWILLVVWLLAAAVALRWSATRVRAD
jgi:ABC-2 type transport system permease protein